VTTTYLDKILAFHRRRAAADTRPLGDLRRACDAAGDVRDFAAALRAPGLSVIAEVKRRSPSKGDLAADLDPAEVAREYEAGGAACLSVLTDAEHFDGSAADLEAARSATTLPVIRKDFTVCRHDVYDARVMGADAVLLIVAALTDSELADFSTAAGDIGLAALFEIHDEAELERALVADARIIGVNQRDLVTFEVDQQRAVRMAPQIPSDRVRVAESGVRGPDDAAVLHDAGYDAILVGESVVTANGRAEAVRALRQVKGRGGGPGED
jgi:indole-3-glycerol phosphate synthase